MDCSYDNDNNDNTDNNNYYYNKYLKYKSKYLKLKSNSLALSGGKFRSKSISKGFYITHGTSKLSNLLSILKDGKIKLGKDVSKSNRMLSEGKANKQIYANIYFDDFVKSMDDFIDYTIILSPDIILDYDIDFRSGWSSDPESSHLIKLSKSDSNNIRETKLNQIKSYISTTLKSKPNIKKHELVFDKPIDISKYIIGVTCINCGDDYPERYIQIKKFLRRNNQLNVKIITKSKPITSSFFN